MSLLEVTGLTHSYGDKALYQNASFALYKGEHMGVVGQNGAGKSTLIGICTGEVVPDDGRVAWQPNVRIGYLDQQAAVEPGVTIRGYLLSSFAALYAKEAEMNRWYNRYAAGEEEALDRAAALQEELEAEDFYAIGFRVQRVAEGLGLTALGMDRELAELSGGQRAKVILSRLLLEQPDVLLLDEPTNFLDREHVAWLADYLKRFPNAFLVVSHDHDFLEQVSTCICDVDMGEIRKYNGGYRDYLRQKQFQREDYIRRYHAQQEYIQKTEAFIRKNIAGVNSRNAKGRRKQLEHLERIAPPAQTAIQPSIRFPEIAMASQEALHTKDLLVGYDFPLLPPLNLSVRSGQKVVITGFNGIGKSTLLKTLMGVIPALGGGFALAESAATLYYEQELAWEDPDRTPLQLMADAYPLLKEKELRRHLSACAVDSTHVSQRVGTLSGGEQSKVKLCLLLLRPSNFLVLDEPTNHLDAGSKEALKMALERFQGTVLLVSHEESFYRDWAERVIPIAEMRG